MLGRLHRFFGHLASYLTIWQWLGGAGVIGVGAITAWAAAASEWLSSYGAIGWWAAGLLGALVAAAGLRLVVGARALAQVISFRNRVANSSDINPLETVFRHQRIRIGDLSPPIGGFIIGKTFIDCELLGPMNVAFDLCHMTGNGGEGVDGILVNPGGKPTNGMVFIRCTFQNCRFYAVTFMVPEKDFDRFDWQGVNWITRTPIPATAPEVPAPQLPPDTATETPR